MKEIWFLDGFSMRVFLQSADFCPDVESLIAPVWISLTKPPPFFLFAKKCLQSIDRLIGRPLTIDNATADLSRPNTARICVEIDLLKKLPKRVWLKCGVFISSFWQDIIHKRLPHYCKHCMRLGHEISTCKQVNPHLAKMNRPDKGNTPSAPVHKQKDLPQATKANAPGPQKDAQPVQHKKSTIEDAASADACKVPGPVHQNPSLSKTPQCPEDTYQVDLSTDNQEQSTKENIDAPSVDPTEVQVSCSFTQLTTSNDDLSLNKKSSKRKMISDEKNTHS